MPGKGARERQAAKRKAWRENRPYSGFTCRGCGHPDYAHFMWAAHCIHNEMKPKDNTTCNCQGMDEVKE